MTFHGTNFLDDPSLYKILIDEIPCVVQSATTSSVTCITGKRPGLQAEPSLTINIQGFGNVATQDVRFRYVYFWSNPITWGGEFPPIDGDMVYIPPGLHLLVDVDETALLSAVVV